MAIDSLLEQVQIDVKETGLCTRKVEAKYSVAQVDAAFKDAVREVGKYAQLPGFRKGKVPPSMVMAKYKDYIRDDVTKALQQNVLRRISDRNDLDIVTFGRLDAPGKPQPGQEYVFALDVEIAPEFVLPRYKGLQIKVEEKETPDQHCRAQLEYLKNLYAEFVPVSGPAAAGDMLKVSYDSDFELPADASAVLKRALRTEEGWFYLTGPEQIPGMVKAMTGAQQGDEVKFTAEFPASWRESALAGKKVAYTVKVIEVQRRAPVESEEKLAVKLGMENVDKMREFLKQKAENELKAARMAQIREQAAEQVVASVADFELPKGFLAITAQREFSKIADQLVRKQEDVEKFKADKERHMNDALANAAKRVKKFFVLRKIAEAEKITVSDAEVEQQIRQMGAYLGRKEKEVRKLLDGNGGYSEIHSDILMSKVVDFIASQAQA